MSYTHFCLHNASFHLDLQITHIAICILQITLLVRFLNAKRAFSFAQMVKIYIFYATSPHAMPLTDRLNAQFGIVGYLFFWCAEPDYTFKNIEKHHHHSPLYTTCANRAQSGKSGILKNRTIIGLIPTSHVSSCPRGPTDKKNLPYL